MRFYASALQPATRDLFQGELLLAGKSIPNLKAW